MWAKGRLGYRPGLGVRALAVLAVLGIHGGLPIPGGFLGVDVFFVLSGFLITILLIEEFVSHGAISKSRFYWRRTRRLFPALFVTLLAVAAAYATFEDIDRGVGFLPSAVAVLLYVGNWVQAPNSDAADGQLGALDHTWSLAIEEQFYLLWPPLLIVLLGRNWRPLRIILLLVMLAMASAVLRVLTWGDVLPGSAYFQTHTHADGILLGCALGVAWCHPKGRRVMFSAGRPIAVAAAAFAVLAAEVLLLSTTSTTLYFAGFTAAVVAAAALIAHLLAAPDSPVGAALASRPLVWVGMRSYGIYLYHLPVFYVLTDDRTGLRHLILFPLRVTVTVVVAMLSYLMIERPIRHWTPRQLERPCSSSRRTEASRSSSPPP